jgi:hypothetical protein
VSITKTAERPSLWISVSPLATIAILAVTAVLVLVLDSAYFRPLAFGCILLAVAVGAAGFVWTAVFDPAIARSAALNWRALPGRLRRCPAVAGRLLAQLSPVILLSISYRCAAPRLSTVEVAGLPLPRLLIATSLTAPWLSQIVCMPLFNALDPHLPAANAAQLRARALEAWPWILAASLPVVIVMAIPVWLTEHWHLDAMLAYTTLCLLNAAFAQSLVYSIVKRSCVLWAMGWAAYAGALLAVPRLWLLPPLAGLLLESLYLGWDTQGWRFRPAKPRRIMPDLAKGTLLGCVLWSDKYLYFLRFPGQFSPALIFGAMLPAIVAYNYFFVMLAPRTDGLVDSVRKTMTEAPISRLRQECGILSGHIRGSLSQVSFLCAVLSLASLVCLKLADPAVTPAVGAEMLACWCFVMGALACYKLAYLGQTRLAYSYGALHLVIVSVTFAISPSAADVYLALAAIEFVLVTVILRICLRGWDRPEFMLFWRHALRW